MNELELLRRMRAEVAEPSDDQVRTGEARLITAIRGSRRPARSRPRPAVLWPGLTTGVALAVAATAIAVGSGEVTGAPDGPTVVPAAATQLLDRAALAAEQTPELDPRADQFIVYKSIAMDLTAILGDHEQRYLYRVERELWASVDGKHDGALRRKHLEPRPYPGWPMPAQAHRRVGTTELIPLPACDSAGVADQFRRDYAYLKTLPTDVDGMLAALERRTGQDSPAGLAIWTAVGDLLAESYLPPAQRAAVFRAAKRITGVTVVAKAKDAADRTGVAVARDNEDTGIRTALVFDPVTYRYLGESSFVVDAGKAAAPVGSQVSATAELSVTVSDTAPAPAGEIDADGQFKPNADGCK